MNTKLHAIVDGLGNPVEFLISAGNDADSKHAIDLLKKVDITKSNILGDKAYGSKEIRSYITENGESYTIPPKSNTKEPWACDYYLYKERHLVECFFQKLKWFRRIATRYDTLDASFLCLPCFYYDFVEMIQLSLFFKQGLVLQKFFSDCVALDLTIYHL